MTKRDRVGGWVKNDHFRRDVIMQWPPSGFSGYIWLDTKIVLKKR